MNYIKGKVRSTIYQNEWNAAKIVLRGKLYTVALYIYTEKEERFQIDNIHFYFKQEKEWNKYKVRRQKKLLR